MFWHFLSLTPESIHQVTILFSDRGTPRTYRHMNGYSSHTFMWYNEEGDYVWVQYHFKTEQGIQNLSREEADLLKGVAPDHATRDLYESIGRGEFPSWRLEVQVMTPEEADTYRFDPFDITKVWPHADVPPIPVGRMVLNRNPESYFAEVEQSAFSSRTNLNSQPASAQNIVSTPSRVSTGTGLSGKESTIGKAGFNGLSLRICPCFADELA